jgi:hypothetical protein
MGLFSVLRLLARFTAGLSRFTAIVLTVVALGLAVPVVGAMADWLAQHSVDAKKGIRPFLQAGADAPRATCVGVACGVETIPLVTARQVGGVAGHRFAGPSRC